MQSIKMRNDRKKRKTLPLLDLDKEREVNSKVLSEELLPRIPNEITLNQILTKLPHWKNFQILASVNRSWLEAVRTGQVYEARVRSNSTETLAVIHHVIDKVVSAIALYSVRDERICVVPPIPQLGGIPAYNQCVSVDGKLYVLGGVKDSETKLASDEVYVLNLARQSGWRRCASMQQPRQQFGCGVLNGKIYVCGGLSLDEPVPGTEVYSPKVDAWSPLPPMISLRFGHRLSVCAELGVLCVHGGKLKEDRNDPSDTINSDYVEVYYAKKKKWHARPLCFSSREELIFSKEGVYSIKSDGFNGHHIRYCQADTGRTFLQTISRPPSIKLQNLFCSLVPVVIDDELVGVGHWRTSVFGTEDFQLLVRSRGFFSGKEKIVWEDARWSGTRNYTGLVMNYIMCTVRL